MRHYDITFEFKINVSYVIVTYILWSSDFALYLEDFLNDELHTLG